ncbi:hypothetical protein THIOM_005588 [Candidatus Thiomargarita nelsonii]|uniref:Uncharacterized protein n=1 Tax=Candidatus Thiomargarita nelsonii TaxID=1003181 RepID=A0A176RSV9_9GAMM|nr:hypothetical protein THIOM_005588 [Candidatus Thiomargarita nelsonii]
MKIVVVMVCEHWKVRLGDWWARPIRLPVSSACSALSLPTLRSIFWISTAPKRRCSMCRRKIYLRRCKSTLVHLMSMISICSGVPTASLHRPTRRFGSNRVISCGCMHAAPQVLWCHSVP